MVDIHNRLQATKPTSNYSLTAIEQVRLAGEQRLQYPPSIKVEHTVDGHSQPAASMTRSDIHKMSVTNT